MKLSYLKKPLAAMLAFTMTLSMNTMPAFAADGTDSTEYKYVYAGLTWDEYWENEGVYLSGTDWIASSAELAA